MKIAWLLLFGFLHSEVYSQQDESNTDSVNSESTEQESETMVVTAQRRKQALEKVPIAISAYAEEDLQNIRLHNITDIANISPSFSIGQFNIGQAQLYIRGIGSNEDGAGGDNSVVVFIDGVYIGRSSASLFDFYDVARVEVLRGPQGTLYGKNVIGGAINVITHKAEEVVDQQLHASIGKDNLLQLKTLNAGYLDGEQSIAGKVALLMTEQDGYIESRYGFDLNDKSDQGLRAEVSHESEQNFTTRLALDWLKQRQSGAGRYPNGGTIGDEVLPIIDAAAAADPLTSFADVRGFQHKDIVGISISNHWQNDWGQFSVINAWRRHEFSFLNDDLAISEAEFFLDIENGAEEVATQRSHELRWQQTIAHVDVLSGVYALYEHVQRDEFFAANITATGTSLQQSDNRSLALYTHAIYPFNEVFELTVGARYTWEQKKVNQQGVAGFVINEDYAIKNSDSWRHFTPKVAVSYQLDSRQSIYLSATRGFKSGGFQGQAPTAAAAETPFNEEIATNYEVGYKARFKGGQTGLRSALFQTNYQDLQVLELMEQEGQQIGVLVTQNAAEAKVRGVEFELKSQLTQALSIGLNYAYLDAKYSEFYQNQEDSRTGNYLRNAPKHAGALLLEYIQELDEGSSLSWRYNHSYQGKRFQEPENLDGAAIPSYDLANASLSYQPKDLSWQLMIWIDNLWDEDYFMHNFPIGAITNPASPAPPRRYGITISFWY